MCGRFLTPDQAALERHWGLAAPPDYAQSYNLAPSQPSAVVRLDANGDKSAALMTWGFQPNWAKRAWINARSETAFTSKAFGSAARARRCLIPAIGWYEWQGAKAPKQPYVFHIDGFLPFAFAGIWTGRETAAGWQRSFAILTRQATETLRDIHDRMPAILRPDQYLPWMSGDTPGREARDLLAEPFRGISAYPVSSYVNKPVNNDAQCIQPQT